jgi:hypothetical protein
MIWRVASVLIFAAVHSPYEVSRMAVQPIHATSAKLHGGPTHIQCVRSKRPAFTAVAGSVATTRRSDRSGGREVQRNSAPT